MMHFTFENASSASYDPSELGTMLRNFHLLIKVTLKLKGSILVLDKHKAIIIYNSVILEGIYGHFVINKLLRAVEQYCAITLFHYIKKINLIYSRPVWAHKTLH